MNRINEKTIRDIISLLYETKNQSEKNPKQFVLLKEYTIEPLVKLGIDNLPMMERRSHVRENILTEEEAQKLGFSIKRKHFHGLGIKAYIDIINSMDNPLAIYKYTNKGKYNENNYIIITPINLNGQKSIVPIEINNRGQYNQIEIRYNRIKSVYFGTNKNKIDNLMKEGKIKEIFTHTGVEQTSLDK